MAEALRSQQGLTRDGGAAPRQLAQVSRLTIALEEAATAAQLLGAANPITASYDLLAVQPLSERVFQQVPLHIMLSFTSWPIDACRPTGIPLNLLLPCSCFIRVAT